MSLHIIRHPVCDHVLSLLRDKNTTSSDFRELSKQVTAILALEATKDLPVATVAIETPLEPTQGKKISVPIVTIAILRAGISMVDTIVDLIPGVSVGFVGMERDEETAEAHSYYCKLPPLEGKRILVVDPMLATGGSSLQSIRMVYDKGGSDVSFLNIVAAPEGVELLQNEFPDLEIYTAALDRELNDQKYILPGLGDFGDRLYGT